MLASLVVYVDCGCYLVCGFAGDSAFCGLVWCGWFGFGGFVYLVCFAAFGFGFDTGLLGCLFWFRSFGLCLIISGCCLW